MARPKVSRTYGPIHFEDLDPHRFEDLIRELIYDFKDWQSIEATGRGGSDDGFDIRAYEKVEIISQSENNKNEVIEEIHPMEGNLWMIQGKREKEIGPKKLKEYLGDVDEKNPPYGYILAASTNFSKKAYDVFREELRKKGVMEFYLWSKAELEDMLHLPKNDRILFTFFGYSLVSRRRSRTTEVRSVINTKNKLYQILGDGQDFHRSILLRELRDEQYPYKEEYKDFNKKPRWKEYVAFGHHSLGLLCHKHKYLAYIDTEKKEWDCTEEIDLIFPQVESDKDLKKRSEKQKLVNYTYDFLPRDKQGYYVVEVLLRYSDIMLIDKNGDEKYKFPHIYIDSINSRGPFSGKYEFFKIGEREFNITKEYKRINVFPKKFKKQKFGKIYKDKKISFNEESLRAFNEYRIDTLYADDSKYEFIKQRDLIGVDDSKGNSSGDIFLQITHKFREKVGKYLEDKDFKARNSINLQLGRVVDDKEEINIYEFKKIYKWQLERNEV